ncbi:MAG: 4-hydroxy-tetrahydrodipicolinate synthase [Bacteroidia bacterium]|nr:4-hydroxy-tetrahydrodipicolinate synthase [Bacteroidota bacterium]
MALFTGTGVAMVTPFTQDGDVDYAGLRNLTNHLIDGQVEYLVVLGTTGESATLSSEEKAKVIETILETNDKRIPVVLGAGGNNTAHVCKQVEDYTHLYKPAGILSVSPYYNKPTQEGIYQHYKAVAGSTDLPIILYNVPGRTSKNVFAETTLRLAHDVDNIIAVKEASGDLAQCMEIIAHKPEGFEVISGDDNLTVPMASIGADGVISVIGNALPLPFSSMTRAALDGDFAKAREIHYQIMDLMNLNFVENNPGGVKTMLSLLGVCGADVRLPLVKGSNDLSKKMEHALGKINAIAG